MLPLASTRGVKFVSHCAISEAHRLPTVVGFQLESTRTELPPSESVAPAHQPHIKNPCICGVPKTIRRDSSRIFACKFASLDMLAPLCWPYSVSVIGRPCVERL